MHDPDRRFDLWQEAPMPEVSPSQGIRVYDRNGREIVVLPPSRELYRHLLFALMAEIRRRGW